ncbi:MAG: hypothetical protein HPY64_00755 [Anaerolineae bacterium]|nr:hypothetical protein [Anaerolineae bacterium]
MEVDILQTVQRLQFTDREAAQTMLRRFIQEVFELDVATVELRPLAVSLNSFNGFVSLRDGRRLFFKSHVEPGSVIAEYYNSDLLRQAGYPVVMPVLASTVPSRQMLLYEVIEDESLFDAAWAVECSQAAPGSFERLRQAQQTCDDRLLDVYFRTLAWQDAATHARQPVHQLFYHRLAGGRLDSFYGPGTEVALPGLPEAALATVRQVQWTINGVAFRDTLDDIIAHARTLLAPERDGPAVVGHGDAHNGNLFVRGRDLVYFDPAFAGRHDPLLDLVKPLYHNVHAMWMYFPQRWAQENGILLTTRDSEFVVTYPDRLPAIREMFWQSKTQRVLIPLLQELRRRGWLRPDWRAYLQAALACCPLLTMNLADGQRFPPVVALLGLAQVVEMGGRSHAGNSRVERWLDGVEAVL